LAAGHDAGSRSIPPIVARAASTTSAGEYHSLRAISLLVRRWCARWQRPEQNTPVDRFAMNRRRQFLHDR
jgi:hypothetical protein